MSENDIDDDLELGLEPAREDVLKSFLADMATSTDETRGEVLNRYETDYPAAMAWALGEV